MHVHPDGDFARRELHLPNGKTEAWIVLDVDEGAEGAAWLGFRENVEESTLADWYDSQDSRAMLAAMNRASLRAGDVLFVPAGTPHSIAADSLILELQEPADLSVILEYAPFERLEREDSVLDLEVTTASRAVNRAALRAEDLAAYVGRIPSDGTGDLLPPQARPFLQAEWIVVRPMADLRLASQFSVIVVTSGLGELEWDRGVLPICAGDTVLVPFEVGNTRLSGDLSLVRCKPPARMRSAEYRPGDPLRNGLIPNGTSRN
ncbi:hypothetical protein [Rathayibacter soli]|uniref:hypothetical protein n=1 Tax=Rathayibacter soli TaxID=3144168 RepID=UPI0027E3E375|nr:hypothetical protein [Glaciibacter superstes]